MNMIQRPIASPQAGMSRPEISGTVADACAMNAVAKTLAAAKTLTAVVKLVGRPIP
ncbi:MAG: hypothetical protein RLO08_05490 [Parvibaculaceae bacterium]